MGIPATLGGSGYVVGSNDPGNMVEVVLSLDTAIYASGDLLADTQVITNALREHGGTAVLQSVMAIDEDDQASVAMDIYILSDNVSLGTENAAPAVTDTAARSILGAPISIASGDWKDLGGCKVAGKEGLGKLVSGGGADLYVAVVLTGGTPTFTASGVRLKFGFIRQ